MEALRELERLELALVEEKARSFQLCEEMRGGVSGLKPSGCQLWAAS